MPLARTIPEDRPTNVPRNEETLVWRLRCLVSSPNTTRGDTHMNIKRFAARMTAAATVLAATLLGTAEAASATGMWTN